MREDLWVRKPLFLFWTVFFSSVHVLQICFCKIETAHTLIVFIPGWLFYKNSNQSFIFPSRAEGVGIRLNSSRLPFPLWAPAAVKSSSWIDAKIKFKCPVHNSQMSGSNVRVLWHNPFMVTQWDRLYEHKAAAVSAVLMSCNCTEMKYLHPSSALKRLTGDENCLKKTLTTTRPSARRPVPSM